ncbi:MAG: sugar phosphate nucleotidyltransferase [Candidatus Bathyarchaeia archaeon]|jgi:glucose-1-phosphate cytidylyltransferase
MKVVLFCGGLGMRLYPTTEEVPKPLVTIGDKPLLWYLMKYYSFFGHKDFILCLGYKADKIKRFFLDYDECMSSDFTLTKGGQKQVLQKSDIADWNITFADTGLNSNIGQRLKTVQKYLDGEETFLANYSDGLTDLQLPKLVDYFKKQNKIGCFMAVKPFYVFHLVTTYPDDCVKSIRSVSKSNLRINGGFFAFKNSIFDYIQEGEELVEEPFQRLIKKRELVAYKHDGFWASLDTYKDKNRLEEMFSNGKGLWKIWENGKVANNAKA